MGRPPDGVAVAGPHGGVISIVRWSLGQEFTVDEALAEPMLSVFRLRDIDGQWVLDRL